MRSFALRREVTTKAACWGYCFFEREFWQVRRRTTKKVNRSIPDRKSLSASPSFLIVRPESSAERKKEPSGFCFFCSKNIENQDSGKVDGTLRRKFFWNQFRLWSTSQLDLGRSLEKEIFNRNKKTETEFGDIFFEQKIRPSRNCVAKVAA